MEDYIQGVLCGYLTVQNGTRDDAKRKRMFVVLSDARMDYYLTDPRPEFEESITESYTFTAATQVHRYVEINPHAPMNSLCLTTDKKSDVYIADSANDAEVWFQHLTERLEALHQMVVGTLVVRKELSVNQQVQRTLLQTKYTWRLKHLELGRSTLRYCGTQSGRKEKRAMNQFNLTAQSYVSEEPVEVLKSVLLAGFAVSSGELSATELKKIQKDVKLQRDRRNSTSGGSLVYPFVVCTGPAHLHLAASTEEEREQWILAMKMRIIALKFRHNGRQTKASSNQASGVNAAMSNTRMHDFMEVQFVPGGPWKRRYVELENEMLKVKLNASTLGSKFETRLLPSCLVTVSLLKAHAFDVYNMGKKISLAPGTLQDSQLWVKAIKDVAYNVSLERCHKVFHDDITALLAHSVVYNVEVAGETKANCGFVVEKYKKRITVLSHQPPSASNPGSKTPAAITIPQGSVLLGVSQVGMVYDSFETIWHQLRQKKNFNGSAMRLTFRAPMQKEGLVFATFKLRERWTLRRCFMRHGKLRLENCLPPPSEAKDQEPVDLQPVVPVVEVALRDCTVELANFDEAGERNVIKITVDCQFAAHKTIFLRVHNDVELFAWFALLLLECGVAQDDPRYPLTLKTLKKLKQGTPSPLGSCEDQRRQTAKCKVVGHLLSEIEEVAKLQEPDVVKRGLSDQQQHLRDDLLPIAPESPLRSLQSQPSTAFASPTTMTEDDALALFRHLDAIGCNKISSAALSATVEMLTRQLEPSARERILGPVDSALSKLIPASRQFVNITPDQAIGVLKNIRDPQIIELLRKFSRHEVQCM